MGSRLALLIVLVAIVAGCGQTARPRRPGDEYVNKIEIEGNQQVKDSALVTGLALRRAQKRGSGLDPYLVQVDEDRVRGEYLRRGFLAVDVRSRVEREPGGSGDAARVIFTVEEGPRARTRVVIEGLPAALPAETVREQIPLADGAPFDYRVYEAAKERLVTVLQDAGYAHAELDATVYADRANHVAVIQLDYAPGPKCTFGQIEITGVDGELADAVRDRLQFSTGDRYSLRAITATQRRLYAMSRFSTVQVQPTETESPVVDVKIAVARAARHEIKLGGGFGMDPTAYEIRGRAGYSVAGWPSQLDTATVELRPAYAYLRNGTGFQPRMRALAKLERQDLIVTYAKGELEAGYNYLVVEAYTSYGPHGRLGFSTPVLTERVQLRAGWSIERLDFRDISPLVDPSLQMELGLDRSQRIGAYHQALTLDLRDNPLNTSSGVYAELRVAEGTPYAGGDLAYVQVIPELRGFLPLGSTVIAGRVRGGRFYGDVPVTERFFSGGSRHRGFGERSLAPQVVGVVDDTTTEVPYGGTALFETGVEVRIPIATWRGIGIGSVVFLDGGDVTNDLSAIDLSNLHWAIGAGLRFSTIVGPVRADLGYRLDRTGPMEPSPGDRFAFHLSIGEAF